MNEYVNPPPPEPHANPGHETTDVNPYWRSGCSRWGCAHGCRGAATAHWVGFSGEWRGRPNAPTGLKVRCRPPRHSRGHDCKNSLRWTSSRLSGRRKSTVVEPTAGIDLENKGQLCGFRYRTIAIKVLAELGLPEPRRNP